MHVLESGLVRVSASGRGDGFWVLRCIAARRMAPPRMILLPGDLMRPTSDVNRHDALNQPLPELARPSVSIAPTVPLDTGAGAYP